MFKATFLRWWLIVTLISVGTIFAWKLGFIHEVWMQDRTPICVVIAGLFIVMSAWCGIKTFKISRASKKEEPEAVYDALARQQEIGWFVSDQFLTLGLIGTIWGFILMSPDFSSIDLSNIDSLKNFIFTMAAGLGTALYTTLTGLICSGLLRVQYFNLSQELDHLKRLRKRNAKKKNLSCE